MSDILYNWVLIWKATGNYQSWSKSVNKPHCGDPDNLEWIEWGKELPEDIELCNEISSLPSGIGPFEYKLSTKTINNKKIGDKLVKKTKKEKAVKK